MKNPEKQLLIPISYMIIWIFSVLIFWIFAGRHNIVVYVMGFFYLLLPLVTFVESLIIAREDFWGKWKWLTLIILGTMYMLADYCTFRLANNLSFAKLNSPEWELFLAGAGVSLFGMLAGALVRKMRKRRECS